MIPNLQPNTTYAIHLCAASSSGGKEWVGSLTAQGEIHTYWGKSGQIVQHAAKPGDMNILLRITNQKRKRQYYQVDEYTAQHGWQSQVKQAPVPPPPKPAPAPAVDWVEAPTAAIKWDF